MSLSFPSRLPGPVTPQPHPPELDFLRCHGSSSGFVFAPRALPQPPRLQALPELPLPSRGDSRPWHWGLPALLPRPHSVYPSNSLAMPHSSLPQCLCIVHPLAEIPREIFSNLQTYPWPSPARVPCVAHGNSFPNLFKTLIPFCSREIVLPSETAAQKSKRSSSRLIEGERGTGVPLRSPLPLWAASCSRVPQPRCLGATWLPPAGSGGFLHLGASFLCGRLHLTRVKILSHHQ